MSSSMTGGGIMSPLKVGLIEILEEAEFPGIDRRRRFPDGRQWILPRSPALWLDKEKTGWLRVKKIDMLQANRHTLPRVRTTFLKKEGVCETQRW